MTLRDLERRDTAMGQILGIAIIGLVYFDLEWPKWRDKTGEEEAA